MKICLHCQATSTPLWRRLPSGELLCNACGLYYRTRQSIRPACLNRPRKPPTFYAFHGETSLTPDSETSDSSSSSNSNHTMQCKNCTTTNTPLWRKDSDGNYICNACGLYYRLHGIYRPTALAKRQPKVRKKEQSAEVLPSICFLFAIADQAKFV